jgi:hypothetical protein
MMKLISDEEQIREIEFMELQIEFAKNERLWRRKSDYRAAQRASTAEQKLVKMFMDGLTARPWRKPITGTACYSRTEPRLVW